MKLILDASAFLSGMDFPANLELYTTPSILEELKFRRMQTKIGNLIDVGALTVVSPKKESAETITKQASKTGDIHRLSGPDIDILALALELDGEIITDDYSIQNVAVELNIKYSPMAQNGITKKIDWVCKCKGCKRIWKEMYENCPVCGSEIKTARKS
ncbi:MAG: hypothetical protein WC974_05945 [Thermoplasmata archaeon]